MKKQKKKTTNKTKNKNGVVAINNELPQSLAAGIIMDGLNRCILKFVTPFTPKPPFGQPASRE